MTPQSNRKNKQKEKGNNGGELERGNINLTHESKHHHPSHIDPPPPPLACILPPLFAKPLLIQKKSHNLFKELHT